VWCYWILQRTEIRCPCHESKRDTLATALLVWGYAITIQHSCKVHRRKGGPGVPVSVVAGWLASGYIQSRCVVSRAQVSPGGLCQAAPLFVSSANRLLQCWKQFTRTTGLSKQFLTPTILHIRSLTNTFCGTYDRNRRQLWRLGSRDVP
jgi:hypothetical protein